MWELIACNRLRGLHSASVDEIVFNSVRLCGGDTFSLINNVCGRPEDAKTAVLAEETFRKRLEGTIPNINP